MKISVGQKLNFNSFENSGFDAFSSKDNVFILCDGANSCRDSGTIAREFSFFVASNWPKNFILDACRSEKLYAMLLTEHKKILRKTKDAATTIVGVCCLEDELELFSVGDSFIEVFHKSNFHWKKIFSMPRDIDKKGNPWQLIGSEVFTRINYQTLSTKGSYCLFLLTDGAGNYLNDEILSNVICSLNSEKPSSDDLDYIAHNLALKAKKNGSSDDISVVILFCDL